MSDAFADWNGLVKGEMEVSKKKKITSPICSLHVFVDGDWATIKVDPRCPTCDRVIKSHRWGDPDFLFTDGFIDTKEESRLLGIRGVKATCKTCGVVDLRCGFYLADMGI